MNWRPLLLGAQGAVWLIGSILVLLLHAIRLIRLAALLRCGKPIDENLARIIGQASAQMGIRPLASCVITGIGSPVICSLLRPVLLWPAELGPLSEEASRALVFHELAHLKRRDHWVGWLEMLAHCIWWWNPVFWITRRNLRHNAELACDAYVIGALPEARRAYASALVTVCETISLRTLVRPVPALGLSTGGRRLLERRLTMILQEHVPARLSRAAILFLGLLAVATLPAWSQRHNSAADESAGAPEKPGLSSGGLTASGDSVDRGGYPGPGLTDEAIQLLEEFRAQDRRATRALQDLIAERTRCLERLQELMNRYRSSGRAADADAIARRLEMLGARQRQSNRVQADPGTLMEYRGHVGESFYFDVTGQTGQTIWGTEVYTDDSPLAVAAVHAGVLRDGERGIAKVTILPGLGHFEGTNANGVESIGYGRWDGSYHVEAAPINPAPAPTRPEESSEGPIQLQSLRDRVGQVFRLDIVGSREGTVWGTGVYTDDSSVAAAAVHAGILRDGQRGQVKIKILPGQGHYTGSTRNGITSDSWESWQGSFQFVRDRGTDEPGEDQIRRY